MHHQPVVESMLNSLRKRNHVLPLTVLAIGCASSFALNGSSPLAAMAALSATLLFGYFEIMTQLAFRSPSSTKPPLDDVTWNPLQIDVDGHALMMYHQHRSASSPTAVLCHGWTAGAMRMTGRATSFLERGWNVVLFDLPSHGGSTKLVKWNAEQSCTTMIAALNILHEQHPSLFGPRIVFYGHSMGAFMGLRLSKRRDEFIVGQRLAGWIFESPMTGYSEIFQETCNILRIPTFFRQHILKKSLRHFNAINGPERTLHAIEEADAPVWGLPSEPTLLAQALPDERLGDAHYERLIRCMEEAGRSHLLTVHMLRDMRHSGSHEHATRKGLVDEWIDDHSSSD